jgi:glycosyltransferase involved in cell wall biosynthesis
MDADVKISVVIPAYNAERFMPRCLAAVFAQTLKPHEVIVVDDGSTDGTAQLAEKLGATVLRQANAGIGAARNAGIRNASGEWIALLDADDTWVPEKLALQVAAIRQDTILVYTGVKLFDDKGERTVQRADDPPLVRKSLRYRNLITPSSVILRRPTVLAAGGFREGTPTCEDWGMWVRLLPLGSFAAVAEPLTNYYIHPKSISASPEKMLDGLRVIIEPTLLANDRGMGRWIWRRRIWAAQLLSAAFIARENDLAGEVKYIVRSVLAWPSPFWLPKRFIVLVVSLRNKLFGKAGGLS